MTVHSFPDGKFARPEPGGDTKKGLLIAEDGAACASALATAEFETRNPGVHVHQAVVEHEDDREKRLIRERRHAMRRLRLEEPRTRLITAEVVKTIPGFSRLKAIFLIVASIAGLWMGNQNGAKYIVGAGTDLYATDPAGAALFMGIILLAVGGLKAFETSIASSLGKKIFTLLILLLSLPGVLVWICAFSLVFAPDSSGGVARMVAGPSGGQEIVSLLICLHLIADLGLGFLCFSGAERVLLAGNKPDAIDNPEYLYWQKRVQELDDETWLTRRTRALSLDELETRQHAQRWSEIEARLDHERTKTALEHRARAAASAAHADTLN